MPFSNPLQILMDHRWVVKNVGLFIFIIHCFPEMSNEINKRFLLGGDEQPRWEISARISVCVFVFANIVELIIS